MTQALAQGEDAVYFALFSDSIFPFHLCITHRHEPSSVAQEVGSKKPATDSVQTSIEWM